MCAPVFPETISFVQVTRADIGKWGVRAILAAVRQRADSSSIRALIPGKCGRGKL